MAELRAIFAGIINFVPQDDETLRVVMPDLRNGHHPHTPLLLLDRLEGYSGLKLLFSSGSVAVFDLDGLIGTLGNEGDPVGDGPFLKAHVFPVHKGCPQNVACGRFSTRGREDRIVLDLRLRSGTVHPCVLNREYEWWFRNPDVKVGVLAQQLCFETTVPSSNLRLEFTRTNGKQAWVEMSHVSGEPFQIFFGNRPSSGTSSSLDEHVKMYYDWSVPPVAANSRRALEGVSISQPGNLPPDHDHRLRAQDAKPVIAEPSHSHHETETSREVPRGSYFPEVHWLPADSVVRSFLGTRWPGGANCPPGGWNDWP